MRRGFALRALSGSNFVWIILSGRRGGRKPDSNLWNRREGVRVHVGGCIGFWRVRGVGRARVDVWKDALEGMLRNMDTGRHDEASTECFGIAQAVIRGEALRDVRKRALGIIMEVGRGRFGVAD